jgi:hypothetical protein
MQPLPRHLHAVDTPPRSIATGEGVQITRALNRTLRRDTDFHPFRGRPDASRERIARLKALAIARGEYKQANA